MRKNIFFLILLITCFASCKKAEELKYNSPANIVLDMPAGYNDSVIYTFAYTPDKLADTLLVPVRIAGTTESKDRQFILKALTDSSSAIAGKHYQALKDFYIMPAGKGETYVPLIVYNSDPLLLTQSVKLIFKLYPTADFDTSIIKSTRGALVISSTLEQPDWWDDWLGDYYSRTKHLLFLIATGGVTYMTTGQQGGLDAPKNLYIVSLCNDLVSNPQKWVTKNPAKGYVLEQAAGSDDYYFYSTKNPEKKILYKKDDGLSTYHFIDEYGNKIY